MACLNRLKTDIRCLLDTFPKTHPLFRVTSATVDEISCTFVVNDQNKEKKYSINANITETYPSDPPVWFSDSDDIAGSVQVLSTTLGNNNYILGQVIILVEHLCDQFKLSQPKAELIKLRDQWLNPFPIQSSNVILNQRLKKSCLSTSNQSTTNHLMPTENGEVNGSFSSSNSSSTSSISSLNSINSSHTSQCISGPKIIANQLPKNPFSTTEDHLSGVDCENHNFINSINDNNNNNDGNEVDDDDNESASEMKKALIMTHAKKCYNGNKRSDSKDDEDEDMNDELNSDEDMEDDADIHIEMEEESQNNANNEGISTEHLATLERIRQTHRDKYQKDSKDSESQTYSIQATDRLMKELREIFLCDSVKKGVFAVDLVNDNLYEWNVRLMVVDPDSQLHSDMLIMKEKDGRDYIMLNVLFKDSYPFEPPFIRVVHPFITGGYVLGGGAICMELLTKQGWSGAYSMEAIILQISATLVKGKARISFGGNRSQYSLTRAQQSFRSLVQIHEKSGWYTPPQGDG
ncbi:ubiquitin-conjugating enzyme [Blomia tropicalis]|nr:ubiquitin-conjugating enzyme [Blomia tropicalis]